ncbi:MAG: hypothetical protein FWD78_03810 [Treponema sp.]|nr:hypothetical protein [Treponema sp.]
MYFGIDGGGTYSRIAVTDRDGNVVAGAEAGSTNIYSVTRDEVLANLGKLLDGAVKTAGIKKSDLKAGCLGSAGLGREGEQMLFRGFFDTLLGSEFPVKLCSDAEILLCGGLRGLEGYCLISGTGSAAFGRSADGRLVRAGGHGYLLGDEGSASWIGRTAIARVLRSLEGRDISTQMLPQILKTTRLDNSGDLIQYVHHDADKARIAALAPAVTSAAEAGDPLALDILHTGARELALLVCSVVKQSPWINRRELVIAGGVIEHNGIIAGGLREILSRELPGLKVSPPAGTALEGACILARSL